MKIKSIKCAEVQIKDMNDVLKMVELQRDLSIKLQMILERTKKNNEELKKVVVITNQLIILKNKHKQHFKNLNTLTEEEKKEINKLLRDRHIKI